MAGESRPGHAGLSILLVGQDALKAILARPENAALAKRITVRCMTAPLTSAEVREYVAHQLTVTGARPPAFTEDGLQEIATASQGIPRLINTIADLAVLSSVQRRAPTVDAEAVRQSARMLGHPLGHTGRTRLGRARARRRTAPGRRGPARRSALYISILVVLLASGGYLYISGAARDRDAPQAPRTNTLPVALPVAPAFSDRPVSEGVAETMPSAQATEAVPSGLPTPKPWRPEGLGLGASGPGPLTEVATTGGSRRRRTGDATDSGTAQRTAAGCTSAAALRPLRPDARASGPARHGGTTTGGSRRRRTGDATDSGTAQRTAAGCTSAAALRPLRPDARASGPARHGGTTTGGSRRRRTGDATDSGTAQRTAAGRPHRTHADDPEQRGVRHDRPERHHRLAAERVSGPQTVNRTAPGRH